MKIKTLLAASVLVPGLALAAAHQHSTHSHLVTPGFYVKAEAGLSRPFLTTSIRNLNLPNLNVPNQKVSVDLKVTFVGGLGVGYTVNDFFRTDLLFGYRRLQDKRVANKARLYSGLLNVYFDGQNTTMFTPYIMGGLGLAHDHYKAGTTKNNTRFAWNAGTGVYAKVADYVNIDLSYKYLGVRLKKEAGITPTFGANEFLVGVVFKFL